MPNVSAKKLFELNFNPSNFIIASNFSFKIARTTYKGCSIYEYKSEKKISELVAEKYIELGVLKNGKILVKYQLKDLSSSGTFYRELSEVKNIKQLDLSKSAKVYPNPFKGEVSVKIKDESSLQSIKILNSLGQDVSNKFIFTNMSNKKVDIIAEKGLTKGTYIILITTDDYVISKKIIK